jgi:GTPase SAR1 family protein
MSCRNTNVFMTCFPVSKPDSFDNVQTKWLCELNQYSKDPVIILVGTKVDLRADTMRISKLRADRKKPITEKQGEQKAQPIGAVSYFECSVLNNMRSVKAVFDLALKTAMNRGSISSTQGSEPILSRTKDYLHFSSVRLSVDNLKRRKI